MQHHLSRRSLLGRSAAAVGGVALGGSALSACGTGGSGGGGSHPTLQVMYDGIDTELGKQLAAFERANDCKVVVSKFDQVKLNAAIAAGNPPDLVRTSGASEMPNLIARGLVENLDPYFAKSTVFKAADLDPIVGVYRFDGKRQGKGSVYGFPSDFSQDAMLWFNKELFDKAKVSHLKPTDSLTYDDLLDLGKRLTVRKGGKVDVFGFDPVWNFVNQAHLMQMIAQQGGSLWNDDFTKADFTTPEARRALQWYVDWGKARVGSGPLDPISDWQGPVYGAGRIAVVSYGYWFGAWINGGDAGAKGAEIAAASGFVPAPQMGSTRVDACMTATGAWIPKKAAHKELAFKFLEFWRGGAPAEAHFKAGGGLPALKHFRTLLPKSTAFDADHYQTQMKNLKNLSVLQFSPYANYTAVEGAITTNVEAAMKGQTSLDSAIRGLQTAVDAVVQQGKQQLGA
ncbi:extracellular solute-binding protein [Streptomyces spongiae]|uniref:Extracellular solute-binding protein n=1 Tax=Streptomyces spongiae TaxID=565072 RepID=A0A5N8X9W4_9ACTN|nr:extracellular solute-binding protein [Streptomyces spongiae]MPY55986.1 extracellular solute-binding protein [Streptomyces spongiae]